MTDAQGAITDRLEADPEVALFACKFSDENYSVVPDYDVSDPETPAKIVKTLGNLLVVLGERADVDPVALAHDAAGAAMRFEAQPGSRGTEELE